jgi:hypothetical protein
MLKTKTALELNREFIGERWDSPPTHCLSHHYQQLDSSDLLRWGMPLYAYGALPHKTQTSWPTGESVKDQKGRRIPFWQSRQTAVENQLRLIRDVYREAIELGKQGRRVLCEEIQMLGEEVQDLSNWIDEGFQIEGPEGGSTNKLDQAAHFHAFLERHLSKSPDAYIQSVLSSEASIESLSWRVWMDGSKGSEQEETSSHALSKPTVDPHKQPYAWLKSVGYDFGPEVLLVTATVRQAFRSFDSFFRNLEDEADQLGNEFALRSYQLISWRRALRWHRKEKSFSGLLEGLQIARPNCVTGVGYSAFDMDHRIKVVGEVASDPSKKRGHWHDLETASPNARGIYRSLNSSSNDRHQKALWKNETGEAIGEDAFRGWLKKLCNEAPDYSREWARSASQS